MVRHTRHQRTARGSSLIELMVTVVIIGFVIAAISEAIFVNTAWFSVLQNRVENGMAAHMFLKHLSADIKTSYQVDAINSDMSKLVLFKMAPNQFSPDGFFNAKQLIVASQVSYLVEPDVAEPGLFGIRYTNSLTGENRLILRGVLGPVSKANLSKPAIFQYISKQYPCAISDSPTALTGSVVVNLELRRTEFGSDTGAFHKVSNSVRQKSAIALRSETMLRNSLLHGSN